MRPMLRLLRGSRRLIPSISPQRIFDYGFPEFVADPRATIEGIYRHFELPLGEATEAALNAHMAENTKGKHGKHEYDLGRFGLSPEIVHERFGFYMDHPMIQA